MPAQTVRLSTPGGASAVIFPDQGFNCIDLHLLAGADPVKVIHAEPDVLDGGSPTRSGMPVLFPFPNRIANATFDWAGRQFHVPVTHPGDRHAIHGFACRTAWTDYEVSEDGASVTGRFRLSRDAARQAGDWPGDLELSLTYALADDALAVKSVVRNLDDHDVPFGLGFHAYLAPLAEGTGSAAVAASRVFCDAEAYWILDDQIPTGQIAPVSGDRDLRDNPLVGDRVLDDVLTGLPAATESGGGSLTSRAALSGGGRRLELNCDDAWREMVVFTPPNRESIAIEPYTCPTDAVHLASEGRSVGWRVLQPAEEWAATMELKISEVP